MKTRSFVIFAALAALAAGCTPPKYASYESVSRDFTVAAPWGWNVVADADHDAFSQVVFIGPFDKDFYLGAPTLSVRWYKPYRSHTLRDGSLEMYAGSDDFIRQTLKNVYGKDAAVYGDLNQSELPLAGNGRTRTEIEPRQIPTITLRDSGLKAKYFAVFSPAPAGSYPDLGSKVNPSGGLPVFEPTSIVQQITIGTFVDQNGVRINQRYHEYVVVPIPDANGREEGFYVLCYPATLAGHDKGLDRFHALINTFHPYTAGPGGEKIKIPGPHPAES